METRRHPEGVEYVFVNGEAVVERGRHTDARPGRVLKREA
jgi:N-acyl-D-amino-acid deacylase